MNNTPPNYPKSGWGRRVLFITHCSLFIVFEKEASVEAIYEELRRRREELGLSLEDLSQETNINVQYLKAIEEGDFGVLPRAYIRMFLKAYGLRVGMDAESVLRRFDERAAPEEEPARKSVGKPIVRSASPKKGLVMAGALFGILVVIVGVLKFGAQERLEPRRTPSLKELGETGLEQALMPDTVIVGQNAEGGVGEGDSVRVPKEAVGEAAASSIEPSENAEDSILILEGVALEDIWLSVRADGRLKTYRLMKAGGRGRWEAKDRFEVTLGKPKRIALMFRGEAVDNTRWNSVPVHLLFSREGVRIVEKKRRPGVTPASVTRLMQGTMSDEQ
jgi:transcriptional regulator with XRE-family HTH domain